MKQITAETAPNTNHPNKKLEGIQCTKELQSILQKILDLPEISSLSTESTQSNSTTPELNRSCKQRACSHSKSPSESKSILQNFINKKNGDDTTPALPIPVLKAMKHLLIHTTSSTTKQQQQHPLISSLEQAISQSKLQFTPPPPPTAKDPAYQKRITRLRLLSEERSYQNLTSNLSSLSNKNKQDDDVTARSMTYAASVGLNMIVAPISFGVLMYFFAGAIFNWVKNDDEEDLSYDPHRVDALDIRRVIAGVVCGVGMLFVEMILFVIRTHTLEMSVMKKKKRSRENPFGLDLNQKDKRTFMG